MFYTFTQNRVRGNLRGEHLLCVEADNPEEANERAIYFGLELGVIECPCCSPRWRPASRITPRRTDMPWWNGNNLDERFWREYGVPFSILYKNDNLFSTGSLSLENEIAEPEYYAEDDDVPEASEHEEDWHIYDSGYYDDYYDNYEDDGGP